MIYFPLISSVISAFFAFLLVIQYYRRRKKHQLVWAVSLLMFFATTFFEFLAEPEIIGWNETMYKLYYVLTPPMVALMGAGCLYLLTHKPWGKYFIIYTIVLSIPLFALGLTAPVEVAILEEGSEIGGAAMPQYVRVFSPLFTIPGGIALIAGAIYSFMLDRTRKYNLLIALGGLFPFLGGLKTRLGDPTFFYLFETLGTLFLFLGFLLSWEYIRTRGTEQKKT